MELRERDWGADPEDTSRLTAHVRKNVGRLLRHGDEADALLVEAPSLVRRRYGTGGALEQPAPDPSLELRDAAAHGRLGHTGGSGGGGEGALFHDLREEGEGRQVIQGEWH